MPVYIIYTLVLDLPKITKIFHDIKKENRYRFSLVPHLYIFRRLKIIRDNIIDKIASCAKFH